MTYLRQDKPDRVERAYQTARDNLPRKPCPTFQGGRFQSWPSSLMGVMMAVRIGMLRVFPVLIERQKKNYSSHR